MADNRLSNRSDEEIAASRQARLRARMLKSLLKANAYDLALQTFVEIMNDPATQKRTKRAAAASLAAAYGRMIPTGPQVQVDARQQTLNMADLLALSQEHVQDAPELPNRDRVVSPELQAGGSEGVEAFTPTERSDLPLSQRVTDEDSQEESATPEVTEGSSLDSTREGPADTTEATHEQEDPTESFGDTAPSSDTSELDDLLEELDR